MAPRKTLARIFLCLAAVSSFGGSPASGAPDGSLYARLGGASTVSMVVERAVTRVAASFDATHLQRMKSSLNARICALAGGGCRTNSDVLELSDANYLALVEELRGAMRAERIPIAARNELLELLAAPPRGVARF